MADPQWRIREAGEADLLALARLMADAPLLQRYATSNAQALEGLRQAHAERDILLVLHDARCQEVQGLAWVILTRAFDYAAYLRLLLVSEQSHGAGGGRALMAEVEARAQDRAKHLYLMVTRDNARARGFYERLGFRAIGDLPAHVRPDLDEVLYHKRLR